MSFIDYIYNLAKTHISVITTIDKFKTIVFYHTSKIGDIYLTGEVKLLLLWISLVSYMSPDIYKMYSLVYIYITWFFLGVMSSIGFGTGLQTGLLFVCPYVINYYIEHYDNTQTQLTNIYIAYICCFPRVFIWAVGSAFGELPPYLISKKINYSNPKSVTKLSEMLGIDSDTLKTKLDRYISRFKNNKWMTFITLIICSSYPNALFDMCGVASGIAKIPMYDFLIPTIIGKACIKTPIQLYIILYSYSYYGERFDSKEISIFYYIWIVCVSLFTLSIVKVYIETVVKNNKHINLE